VQVCHTVSRRLIFAENKWPTLEKPGNDGGTQFALHVSVAEPVECRRRSWEGTWENRNAEAGRREKIKVGKKIAVLIRDRQEEGLRMAVGLTLMDDTVDIFVMDDGVKLLCETVFSGLCSVEGIQMSFCDHSTEQLDCKPKDLPRGIVCGSQYDNTLMSHASDRIIVI
jgi:hypothetical protein